MLRDIDVNRLKSVHCPLRVFLVARKLTLEKCANKVWECVLFDAVSHPLHQLHLNRKQTRQCLRNRHVTEKQTRRYLYNRHMTEEFIVTSTSNITQKV